MDEADIGRIGEFSSPMLLKDVIKLVANNLGLSMRQIRVTGDLNTEISKVNVLSPKIPKIWKTWGGGELVYQ